MGVSWFFRFSPAGENNHIDTYFPLLFWCKYMINIYESTCNTGLYAKPLTLTFVRDSHATFEIRSFQRKNSELQLFTSLTALRVKPLRDL